MRVGVEIGGTFTDLVAIGPGRVEITKVPSVPGQPDKAVFDALRQANIDLSQVGEIVHGSTVATNAVLERKGARLAFLVTEGFSDVLQIQRLERRRLFDLFYQKPVALAAKEDTLAVPERTLADGSIVRELDEGFAGELERFLSGRHYEAVAICLLNSFANTDHERKLAAMVKRIVPDMQVTCSHEISREYREFERAATTTVAAYVQPVISTYLERMSRTLAESGFRGRLDIMQSNGARIPVEGMQRNAANALLSGPAAGVTGAIRQVGLSGFDNIITLDVGGTSADVSLVDRGRARLSQESKIDGLPIGVPMLDIATVGAGGGSIVWADDGGMIRVGPQSAGAVPGPASYGRGGELPTLTDAQVICGRFKPQGLLGGAVGIDVEAAARAFGPIARTFNLSLEDMAESAIRIVVSNVAAAIRLVSTERGRDPRDYALVAFGGAGPLHAAEVADMLHISTVIVPPNAGVISAYGLLAADYSIYENQTRLTPLNADAPAILRDVIAQMEGELHARADGLGLSSRRLIEVSLDMRFEGQAFEVPVSLDEAEVGTITFAGLERKFLEEHEKLYGYGLHSKKPAEIVSYRSVLRIPNDDTPSSATSSSSGVDGVRRKVFVGGAWEDVDVFRLHQLGSGTAVTGPALIDDATTTVWIPGSWAGRIDGNGNLVLRKTS